MLAKRVPLERSELRFFFIPFRLLSVWCFFRRRDQDIPEIFKTREAFLLLPPNLFNDPDEAVGDTILSPVDANDIGVQIFSSRL